jgi:hypothetical protein
MLVFIWLNLLIAVFTDALYVHNALKKEKSFTDLERSKSRLFEGVELSRVEHLNPIVHQKYRYGRGFTFRALVNVISEVDRSSSAFKSNDHESRAKKKWKLASRVLLERNRLIKEKSESEIQQEDLRLKMDMMD